MTILAHALAILVLSCAALNAGRMRDGIAIQIDQRG